jgi:hypothetical protein
MLAYGFVSPIIALVLSNVSLDCNKNNTECIARDSAIGIHLSYGIGTYLFIIQRIIWCCFCEEEHDLTDERQTVGERMQNDEIEAKNNYLNKEKKKGELCSESEEEGCARSKI